jgi:hypothetical protein
MRAGRTKIVIGLIASVAIGPMISEPKRTGRKSIGPLQKSMGVKTMSKDNTEAFRREMLESGQPYRDLANANQRWDSDQLREEFEVLGFLAPFVAVKRKKDGVKGSLEFTHSPRWYFNFMPDDKS